MNLKEQILQEHSKQHALKIVEFIGDNQQLFNELITLFLHDTYRVTQRAAWIVGIASQKNPELIKPHLEKIILNLRKSVHIAVKRNTVRILQDIEIPDEFLGELADICFSFLASKDEPIAVKVFSMSILYNISLKEPDLQNELRLLIEEQMPYGSAGFVSRGKKILKAINKKGKGRN